MKIGYTKWQCREDLPKQEAERADAMEKILESIPQYRSKNAWAAAISKQHAGERGFSIPNLHKLALQWRRSGQDWRILVKYFSLWRDKEFLLRKHGLTPEIVQTWIVRGAYKQLAQQFGMNKMMVALILRGESSGLDAENLIREVAKLIYGSKATAQKELADRLEEQRALQFNLEKLNRQIKQLKKKLGTFSAIPKVEN